MRSPGRGRRPTSGRDEGRHGEDAPINPAVPADVKAQVAKLEADIVAGKLHPFAGPVVDQDGKTRVPAGRNMADDELGKMDYYVEGVASKLPKK